jgi:hypothetical protein
MLPFGHRLADLAPHFWLAGDELLQFSCRWSGKRAVPVWPLAATPDEMRVLARALAVLGEAVPGLELELVSNAVDAAGQGIAVAFADAPPEGARDPAAIGSGDAVADCRVDEPFGDGAVGASLRAQLDRASVRILRSRFDLLGRPVALDELELLAALLHELGHAIGFSSHPASGATVMRAAPGEVRLRVRPVLRGEPLRAPTLAALYALPSGTVLRRDPSGPTERATARVFGDLARRGAWGRAHSRAGEDSAEVWWPAGDDGRRVLRASRAGAWPERFALRANALARAALRGERARDRGRVPIRSWDRAGARALRARPSR